MPDNDFSHDVFISYSRKNKADVLPIKDEIERLGLTCWIDLSDIPSGENFKKIVIPDIRQTRVAFLFFLSAESQGSEYAMKEINFAKKRAKTRVVLVRFNDDEMTDDFFFDFQDADIIDWRVPEQKDKLLHDLVLWSGNGEPARVASSSVVQTLVKCPICGKKNHQEDTFTCLECGRDDLCLRHQVEIEKTFLCAECAAKAREAEKLLEEGNRLKDAGASQEAAKCFRKAAELGNRDACHIYGDMLREGRGVEKDVGAALEFYRKCDDSDVWIQYNIGMCHLLFAEENGSKDEGAEAMKWLRKSAKRGVPWACVKLGDCHREGIGTPKDFAEAAKWYRKALSSDGQKDYGDLGASQWAERNMGLLYREGQGVKIKKDLVEALKWFRKAEARQSDAADLASKAAAEVLPDVLAERAGDKLGAYWQDFRLIHGVQIRDRDGRLVPLAGLVASNRAIFVGVSIDSLPSNERYCLPNDNPAWRFAQSIFDHCGFPSKSFIAALVVPDEFCAPGGELPYWVVRESNLVDAMLSVKADEAPDWLGKRQDIIRKLETLSMSSEGAEKNAIIHFKADVPEWEDGAALLEKVEKPSHQLVQLASGAAEELDRAGRRSAADNVRAWLEKTGAVKALILPGGAKMEMIWCPPGEFMMGSPETEEDRQDDETRHHVKLTKGFWLGKCPVTQLQWKSVMGSNPSHFKGDDLPVETVSWDDCQEFMEKVNLALACGARLPTEAEWEYACRAGTTTAYCWGGALNGDKANCDGNNPCGTKAKGPYLKKTSPAGWYSPNPWGLYDMHGNVLEWCSDWYGEYPSGNVVDPTGPASGVLRVLRGGSRHLTAGCCRSACRGRRAPGYRGSFSSCGFRLCCSVMP